MGKNAMPVSRARTAYGLLSEIRKLILEEPKRYDQTAWKRPLNEVPAYIVPACGTVCCVAGWVDTLKSEVPVPASESCSMGIRGRYQVAESAIAILGITDDQADTLFDGDKAGARYTYRGFDRVYRIREHARRGAAHIARFQKKYAKQLKAKKV